MKIHQLNAAIIDTVELLKLIYQELNGQLLQFDTIIQKYGFYTNPNQLENYPATVKLLKQVIGQQKDKLSPPFCGTVYITPELNGISIVLKNKEKKFRFHCQLASLVQTIKLAEKYL